METREILELVKSGSMSVEEAEGHFRRQPFEDLGFAKLDLHRKMRSETGKTVKRENGPDRSRHRRDSGYSCRGGGGADSGVFWRESGTGL